jgi:hypothetical protein
LLFLFLFFLLSVFLVPGLTAFSHLFDVFLKMFLRMKPQGRLNSPLFLKIKCLLWMNWPTFIW